MLSNLLADIRYSFRGFQRRPGFAIVIVLTLAFGIGVNVAVYSIFHQLLLQRLPVAQPDRLVNFVGPGPRPGSNSCNEAGNCESVFSYPMFRDLERVAGPFAGVAAHRPMPVNLGYEGQTRSTRGVLVSGSYFGVLGLTPARGRLLGPEDDRIDGEASALVVSYDYWQTSLGADPSAVGRTLTVNGKPLTIVGVAPDGFRGTAVGSPQDVFVPITFRWSDTLRALPNHADRRVYWAYLFARLKPDVTLVQGAAAIAPIYRAILNDVEAPLQTEMTEQTLALFRGKALVLEPGARGQSGLRGNVRAPLTVLLCATAIVLLIACVNIANLMLARGTTRLGEMAIRSSLGAAPRRLLALLSTEALLLAVVAAFASFPVALATLNGIGAFVPDGVDHSQALRLDGPAAALAFGAAALCALVFGVLPALKLARTDPGATLQAGSVRAIGGRNAGRFRLTLTTAQIALSMTLLVLATLFAQSLANVAHVDTGMRTDSVATFSVSPELNGYTQSRAEELYDRLERDLAAQPGILGVASSMVPLLSFSEWNNAVKIEGYEVSPDVDTSAYLNYVGNGFLRTLGVTLLAGRDFTDADSAGGAKVAIVNRTLATRYGLGDAAVGKRIGIPAGPTDSALDIEIVGLIPDTAYSSVKEDPKPQVLVPRRQAPSSGFMTYYVRSALAPEEVLAVIRKAVAALDPNLPATNLRPFEQQIAENTSLDRLVATLAVALAAGATLLAALGLYGVLSYTIAQRTREIGLRLALGADAGRVRRMVLRQVGWMAGIGVPLGLLAAVAIGRAASALLFGLRATDPLSLIFSLVVLSVVVLGATYWPARRASRVNPVTALRSE